MGTLSEDACRARTEPSSAALRRIHIMGAPCSGKTTLARALGARLNIPVYSLDEIMHQNIGEPLKRAVRNLILEEDAFITEGIYVWPEALKRADVVVILDPPAHVRTLRILWHRFLLASGRSVLALMRRLFSTLETSRRYRMTQLDEALMVLGAGDARVVRVESVSAALARLAEATAACGR